MKRLVVISALLAPTIARADDAALECHAANVPISVAFKPEATIKDLASWLSAFTCKNVILGAGVVRAPTAVTLITPSKLTPKQAVQLWVDAVEAAGFIVVQKPDTFIVKLGPDMPHDCIDVGAPPPTPPPRPAVDDVGAMLDAGVRNVGDTHAMITRALAHELLTNPKSFADQARIIAAIKDGKPNGFKLYAIRPSSLFARVGLKNGDTVLAINGRPLASAREALDIYAHLADVDRLVIDLDRRGTPVTITITIADQLPF